MLERIFQFELSKTKKFELKKKKSNLKFTSFQVVTEGNIASHQQSEPYLESCVASLRTPTMVVTRDQLPP